MQLTEDQVMERLRTAIADAGGQKSFAAQHGLSLPYVNDVLHRRRAFADRILEALGIEKIVIYRDTHPDNLPPPSSSAS